MIDSKAKSKEQRGKRNRDDESLSFDRAYSLAGWALKRLLLICRLAIFESSVWRGIPSFAAAPDGPEMRPWDSASAASITSRSRSASVARRGAFGPDDFGDCRFNQVSPTETVSP